MYKYINSYNCHKMKDCIRQMKPEWFNSENIENSGVVDIVYV